MPQQQDWFSQNGITTAPPAAGVVSTQPIQPVKPAQPAAPDWFAQHGIVTAPPAGSQPAPVAVGGGRGFGPGQVGASRGGAPMRSGGPGTASGSTTAPPPPTGIARQAFEDLAGTVGGVAGTAAVLAAAPEVGAAAGIVGVGKAVPWLWRAGATAAGIGGAGVAGGAEAAATGGDPLTAATRQAENEAIGRTIGWGASALGRRLIASRVGRYAKEHLETARADVNNKMTQVLEAARAAVRGNQQGLARAKDAGADAVQQAGAGVDAAKEGVRVAREAGAQGVRQARAGVTSAQSGVEAAEQAGVGQTAAMAARWPRTPPPPAPTQQVASVVQGPAQHSLDRLGKEVEAAAESGPAIPWGPIQQSLAGKAERIQPGVLSAAADAIPADVRASFGSGTSDDQIRALLEKAGIALEDAHPLPGVLGKIMGVTDAEIPFADAHRFKRLLDEAVNWSSPARKQVQQITKGIRNQLRAAMAGHVPYDEATKAYALTRPLFTANYAKGLAKRAVENPDSLVKSMARQVDEPRPMQMLRDVLLHHAEVGGGPAGRTAGAEAWDAVRAAVTHKKFIAPGIEKFEATMAKAHPDWVHTVYGDADGKVVLDNLQRISAAWRQAQSMADRGVAAASQQVNVAKAGVEAASTAARTGVGRAQAGERTAQQTAQQAKDALAATTRAGAVRSADLASTAGQTAAQVRQQKLPTATELKFGRSSLAHPVEPSQTTAQLAHMFMPGHSIFKLTSASRLWLHGPKVNDLIEWAAYSPKYTQMLTKVLTGPAPGEGLAVLARWANLEGSATDDGGLEESMAAAQAGQGGGPPGPRR